MTPAEQRIARPEFYDDESWSMDEFYYIMYPWLGSAAAPSSTPEQAATLAERRAFINANWGVRIADPSAPLGSFVNPDFTPIPAAKKTKPGFFKSIIQKGVTAIVDINKAIFLTPTLGAISLVSKNEAEKLNEKWDVLGDKELAYAEVGAKVGASIVGATLVSAALAAVGGTQIAADVKKAADEAKALKDKADAEIEKAKIAAQAIKDKLLVDAATLGPTIRPPLDLPMDNINKAINTISPLISGPTAPETPLARPTNPPVPVTVANPALPAVSGAVLPHEDWLTVLIGDIVNLFKGK